jgi:N-acetylated-alpha-linked acidic dipeptidase
MPKVRGNDYVPTPLFHHRLTPPEYGLLGSTEWVEEYIPWLSSSAVAYLNIDVAVSGPDPSISATPDLHDIAISTMKKILFPYHYSRPEGGLSNVTLYDVWSEANPSGPGVLGSGSDYTAFLHNGISCIDMGSDQGRGDPIYHYHSNYDTFNWMSTFADPDFLYHKAMGQYLTLLTYHMASDDIAPLNPVTYGAEMTKYLNTLTTLLTTTNTSLDLSPLVSAIESFNSSAAAFSSSIASASTPAEINTVNSKLRAFSRGFVSQGGLPTREFYKHVVFAPGVDTGYAPVTWPGITEAVDGGDLELAREWVGKSARGVRRAGDILMP